METIDTLRILEEKIKDYKELKEKLEELEEKRKALASELLNLMPKETKTIRVLDHLVKRMTRLSIRISLDQAREIGAVKMEEVVDKEKVKELFELGHSIPDVSEIQYLQVSTKVVNEL